MKRTLLHTSLLALLACCSVSMDASAMSGDATQQEREPSTRPYIYSVRVLPLLNNQEIVDTLLRSATMKQIQYIKADETEDEEETIAMNHAFTSGER